MTDYLEELFQPPEALTKAAAVLDEVLPPRRTAAKGEAVRKTLDENVGDIGRDLFSDDPGADWSLIGRDGIFRQEEALTLPLQLAVAASDNAVPVSVGIHSGEELAPPVRAAVQSYAAAPSVEVRAVDLAFQRDGRRYDNGFSLY